jgi:hypothetical protein
MNGMNEIRDEKKKRKEKKNEKNQQNIMNNFSIKMTIPRFCTATARCDIFIVNGMGF